MANISEETKPALVKISEESSQRLTNIRAKLFFEDVVTLGGSDVRNQLNEQQQTTFYQNFEREYLQAYIQSQNATNTQ